MSKPHGNGVPWESLWGAGGRGWVAQGSPSSGHPLQHSWGLSPPQNLHRGWDGGKNPFRASCSGSRLRTAGFAPAMHGFNPNCSFLSPPPPAFQGPQGLQGRRGPPGLGGTQVNDAAGAVLAQRRLSKGQDPPMHAEGQGAAEPPPGVLLCRVQLGWRGPLVPKETP